MPTPKLFQDLRFFRQTLSVPGLSAELGRIISEPLPTATSIIIAHDSHGAGTRASSNTLVEDGAFSNREPHLMIGIFGAANPKDEEGLTKAKAWTERIVKEITAAGLAMSHRYINFNDPMKGDGFKYYGAQGLARIRAVKGRLDPTNVFVKGTPDLADTANA